DADLLWKRLSERYLMVVLEALRGWLDVGEGSVGGIEKIVRSVARSRTEGESLHLTYTLLLLARAPRVGGELTGRWLTAAGKPKPPPLLCAVPSRSPALKGRAGWSFGRSTPSPVDFPIRKCVSNSGTSSRRFRRAMISRRSGRQPAF